jgi:cytochrome c556
MEKLLKICGMLGIVVAVGLMSTSIPKPAFADSNDVKERRALMKSTGKNLRGAFGFLKGKGGSPESVAANARVLAANAKKMTMLFAPNTGRDKLGSKATRAKADIWQNRAKFDAIANEMAKLAQALEAAALTGDKKKIGAAAGAIGKQSCQGCHKSFRGPKHKG